MHPHEGFLPMLRTRLLVLGMLLVAGPPLKANPTVELLQIAPPGTSVCFVVQNLRDHVQAVAGSPFAEFFEQSPLGQSVARSADWKRLREIEATFSEELGLPWADLRDEILGDAVVLAYHPGTPGKPETDSGVLLVKPRDPKRVLALLNKLNETQKASGELLQVVEKTHRKEAYFERQRGNGKREYVRLHQGVLVVSGQEAALQATIDRQLDRKPNEPRSGFVLAYEKLKLTGAVAAILFDPRTLDGEFQSQLKSTKNPAEKAVLNQMANLWTAADAVGLSLAVQREAELTLGVAFVEAKIPEAIRPLLKSPVPSTLWNAIPPEALFAWAGHLDLNQLLPAVQSLLSPDDWKNWKALLEQTVAPVFGKDQVPTLMKNLGPDWGMWITAPEKAAAGQLPAVTFALRIRPAGSQDQKLAKAALAGLDFLFQSFRVEYNRGHEDQYRLETLNAGADEIKYLDNEKNPIPGLQPAFALRGDYLIVSTSLAAIRQFPSPTATKLDATQPFLRLNATQLATYLRNAKKPLARTLGQLLDRKPEELETEFADFTAILELLRSLELSRIHKGDLFQLTLKFEFAKPLRK